MPKTIVREKEIKDKLVNDLHLNVSEDVIPSELGKTIVPIYNVNSIGKFLYERDAELLTMTKTFTVPEGQEWEVVGVYCKITTTATVGSRRFQVEFLDEQGVIIWDSPQGNTTSASTSDYTFLASVGGIGLGSSGNLGEARIPNKFRLQPGYQVRIIDKAGIDATDENIATVLYVRFIREVAQ